MPDTLTALYEKTLGMINQQSTSDREDALKALSLLSCARRPLKLSELLHALSVRENFQEIDKSYIPLTGVILRICAGLIRIDESNDKVSLAHHSIQEHLDANPRAVADSHLDFGTICLTYLNFESFGEGPSVDIASLEKRLQQYSLYMYAASNCGYHLLRGSKSSNPKSIFHLLGDQLKLSSIAQAIYCQRRKGKHWHNDYPYNFKPIHLLSLWGLHQEVSSIIRSEPCVDEQDSDGTTSLHLAAAHGHQEVARALIDLGADVNMVNSQQQNAVLLAARSGHVALVEFLLLHKACYNAPDLDGYNALDWAIINGHTATLEAIMRMSDSTVKVHDDSKSRALVLAARTGNSSVVASLIEQGAVDWRDDRGCTALDWAASQGDIDIVQLLLDHGADTKARDTRSNTALHWAVAYAPIVQLLIDQGVELDVQNNEGQTPLMWSSHDGHTETSILLLANHAQVNLQDHFGCSALHAASLRGQTGIIQILLDHGADPTLRDCDQWTPLHAAAIFEHEDAINLFKNIMPDSTSILSSMASKLAKDEEKMMYQHMAALKSKGSESVTGLRSAVEDGFTERIQLMLNNGADVDAIDIGGYTALTIAAEMGQESAARILLENGADVNLARRNGYTALHLASEQGDESIAALLVEHGADVNARIHGFTPLLIAASKGHAAVVQRLILNGADISAIDYHGRSATHWISICGPDSLLRFLLDQHAPVDAYDRWKRTPLMWAIERRNFRTFRVLIQGGADVRAVAADGSTALHLATQQFGLDEVSQIIDRGALVDAATGSGITALHVASFYGYPDVVQLLVLRGASMNAKVSWPNINLVTTNHTYADSITETELEAKLERGWDMAFNVTKPFSTGEIMTDVLPFDDRFRSTVLGLGDLETITDITALDASQFAELGTSKKTSQCLTELRERQSPHERRSEDGSLRSFKISCRL